MESNINILKGYHRDEFGKLWTKFSYTLVKHGYPLGTTVRGILDIDLNIENIINTAKAIKWNDVSEEEYLKQFNLEIDEK